MLIRRSTAPGPPIDVNASDVDATMELGALNVIIGANCKIGPNCYLRGNTSIGDGCHIGQSVEIH